MSHKLMYQLSSPVHCDWLYPYKTRLLTLTLRLILFSPAVPYLLGNGTSQIADLLLFSCTRFCAQRMGNRITPTFFMWSALSADDVAIIMSKQRSISKAAVWQTNRVVMILQEIRVTSCFGIIFFLTTLYPNLKKNLYVINERIRLVYARSIVPMFRTNPWVLKDLPLYIHHIPRCTTADDTTSLLVCSYSCSFKVLF